MSQETDETSTSILKRTVKNIKRNRKARSFIAIKKEEIQRRLAQQPENGDTGVVYLRHIPPGFYEEEMSQYFSQFGKVLHVKLERSEKTGRSKGYAYIQFEYAAVAKIVAETMNNYILFNRLLKASFVEHKFHYQFWNNRKFDTTNYPKFHRRNQNTYRVNKHLSSRGEKIRVRKRLKHLDGVIERLKAKGIDYSYKPAIRKEIADSSCSAGKYVRLNNPDSLNVSQNGNKECSKENENENKVEDFSSTGGKFVLLKSPSNIHKRRYIKCSPKHKNKNNLPENAPVLEIDESDEEIVFLTPPNVIKKKLKMKDSKTQKEGK